MPTNKKNIGESPEHLGMQLGTAVARVEMLARRLNPQHSAGSLAAEIQEKLREFCRLLTPTLTEEPISDPVVYQANPVSVTASRITGLGGHDANGSRTLKLDDGRTIKATKEMLARIDPKVGDYYVIQQDGYAYLNPAEVFQRKYSPLAAQTEAA
jgi:hypothetical protein